MACACCPINLPVQCYALPEVQALFNDVVETKAGGPGIAQTGVVTGPGSQLIDGSLAGIPICGYTTPAVQISDADSPVLEFIFTTPQDRITRVAEHNQGGGNLNDSDGFGSFLLQVRNSTNGLLFSGTFTAGNGGAPFQLVFPTPLNDVKRMTWSNMKKLNPGSTVSPLAREFQSFRQPIRYAVGVYCDGVISWVDSETGDPVSPLDFVDCS